MGIRHPREYKAQLADRAAALYNEGKSYKEILQALKQEGFKSPDGTNPVPKGSLAGLIRLGNKGRFVRKSASTHPKSPLADGQLRQQIAKILIIPCDDSIKLKVIEALVQDT